MIRLFFALATIITIIFFILVLVLFICQWIIYSRVERTTIKRDQLIDQSSPSKGQKEE